MSRLTTFLTYQDYDEFISTHHCGGIQLTKLNVQVKFVSSLCQQHEGSCDTCIFQKDNPFKAETLLTKKETSNVRTTNTCNS